MEKNKKLLVVDKLNKFFVKSGKMVKVLDDISFDVFENDFFGIIGESGSGKSTTGKCMIRLYSSSSGIIKFDDKVINQKRITHQNQRWLSQNMSMIFQDPMSSLNPKKNVLSIIAEPLVINKTIINDAKELMRVCLKINPYFQNTFAWQDYILTRDKLQVFYEQNIKLFREYSNTFSQFKPSLSKPNQLDIMMIDLENAYRQSLATIIDYSNSIKGLVDHNHKRLKTQDLDRTEIDYYETEQMVNAQLKLVKNPKIYWKLQEQLIAENKILSDIKIEDATNDEQSYSYVESLRNNLISKIKALQQDSHLTESITTFIYEQTNVLIQKDVLTAIQAIGKDFKISTADAEEYSTLVSQKIQKKYMELIVDINQLSDMSAALDKMSLKETEKDVILAYFTKYEELYKIIQQKFLVLKKTNFVIEDQDVIGCVDKINKTSETKKAKFKDKVLSQEKIIEQIQQKLNDAKNHKDQKEEEKAKLAYDDAVKAFGEAKVKRFNFASQDNKEFSRDSTPLIVVQKMHIEYLHKSLLAAQARLKTIVKLKVKALLELALDDKIKQNELKIIQQNIDNKFVTVKAINFELDTYLENVDLYRKLRTTNKIKMLTSFKALMTMITREYVYRSLDEVGLKSEHAYRYPHEFSGGQRQRIVIARALICKPKLIIADEPISALDVSIQAQVINIMRDLAKKYGITYIFIAHDLSMVRYVSNRLIIMHKGKIVEKGDTDEIFKNPVHPYTKSLIKASPELSKIHIDLSSFSSQMDYDAEYTINNQPSFHSASAKKEHFVFATKKQIKKWTE